MQVLLANLGMLQHGGVNVVPHLDQPMFNVMSNHILVGHDVGQMVVWDP